MSRLLDTINKFGPPYPFNGGCHEFFNKVMESAATRLVGEVVEGAGVEVR
jgi:hypothetical protein